MKPKDWLKAALLGSACTLSLASAQADDFNIPAGDLKSALGAYMAETGMQLMVSESALKGARTNGVRGSFSRDEALIKLLSGTGFSLRRDESGAVGIVRESSRMQSNALEDVMPLQLAQASPSARGAVETVTVTSSKLGGADVQSIPIAITALSQEQLTATQTAGGPDLVKQVPNLTFTKTNFTGYSIQIRGIGTQAISVTTDPAVAVAFNDIPFIRNHFFEQEFYDIGQLEVLRGPQGTLYGRNATAGVVNLVSAKPSDQFEAMASAELGNYSQRRFEGMINFPVVDDRLDIRMAGEWTKRQGYSFNELTNSRVDGRDLWSGRVTIGLKPVDHMQMYLIWEHFSENDDRMRTSKQLCKTDPTPLSVGGKPVPQNDGGYYAAASYLSQGCLPESLYSPQSFEVPNGYSLTYYGPTQALGNPIFPDLNPYASATQSQNLHVIETTLDPIYKSQNDIIELNTDYVIIPSLTLTSQTAFNHDFLWSTEDYNRFNTNPGVFNPNAGGNQYNHPVNPDGTFCDPQLGCSNRLVAQDLSTEHSWQLSQEFRLASNFSGPFNFSAGGNYLHYETMEKYYVFINALSLFAAKFNALPGAFAAGGPYPQYVPNVTDNHECMPYGLAAGNLAQGASVYGISDCIYMGPNPLSSLNDEGHNYFLSQNPYVLDSYAGFGETYYNVFKTLKLTAGLRWTEDRKHAPQIPSWLVGASSYGYPVAGNIDQQWDQLTGRLNATWTPQLSFTDQTLIYGSYSHGYKAGGANPPPAVLTGGQFYPGLDSVASYTHPATFKPEFVDAFELGTKNTMLDGALTINGTLFYYNYENYQISQIVDRTAINLNFDAHIKGAEIEATYEPIPGLRFNFSGGYEDARLAKGSAAIDLIDRADVAEHPDWMVVRPYPTTPSNCILPVNVVAQWAGGGPTGFCFVYDPSNFGKHIDPVTGVTYAPPPVGGYPGYPGYLGFDSSSAPNNGEGFAKDLSHNQMPNAPPFTVSFGAQYSMPITSNWAATLRSDFYWQSDSYWRIFNDLDYDKLRGYRNVNLTLILTNQNGWQVMLYDKNMFNTTAITGAFLNTDDTGLTTNVFLTDPKLIGVRITKNW